MKLTNEQINILRDVLANFSYEEGDNLPKKRISVTVDQSLLTEVDRQVTALRYISRNEFITAALIEFCNQEG